MITITAKNLCKSFGSDNILKNINFSLEGGNIHGLVGLNGSGKTVLLKIICGLIQPTSGSIQFCEQDEKGISITSHCKEIGAIIETPGFLPYKSGISNLRYLASIRNIIGIEQIMETMQKVGLDHRSKKMVYKYSLGMRQRLGIAQAIMENPQVLILDEPFNGLDKKGMEEIRTLLKELRDEGRTIMLATHSQHDILALCDSVYEIDNGMLCSDSIATTT